MSAPPRLSSPTAMASSNDGSIYETVGTSIAASAIGYIVIASCARKCCGFFSRNVANATTTLQRLPHMVSTATLRSGRGFCKRLGRAAKVMPSRTVEIKARLLQLCGTTDTPFSNQLREYLLHTDSSKFKTDLLDMYNHMYNNNPNMGDLGAMVEHSALYDAESVLPKNEIFRLANVYSNKSRMAEAVLSEYILCADRSKRNLIIGSDLTVTCCTEAPTHTSVFPVSYKNSTSHFTEHGIYFSEGNVTPDQLDLASKLRRHIVDAVQPVTEQTPSRWLSFRKSIFSNASKSESVAMHPLPGTSSGTLSETAEADSALVADLAEDAAKAGSSAAATAGSIAFLSSRTGMIVVTVIGVGIGLGVYWYGCAVEREKKLHDEFYRHLREHNMFAHFVNFLKYSFPQGDFSPETEASIYARLADGLDGIHILTKEYDWVMVQRDPKANLHHSYPYKDVIDLYVKEYLSNCSSFDSISISDMSHVAVNVCTVPVVYPKLYLKQCPIDVLRPMFASILASPTEFLLDVGLGFAPPLAVLANYHHGYRMYERLGHEFIDEPSDYYEALSDEKADLMRFMATPEVLVSDISLLKSGSTDYENVMLQDWQEDLSDFFVLRQHRDAGGNSVRSWVPATGNVKLFSDFCTLVAHQYYELRENNIVAIENHANKVTMYTQELINIISV